MRGKPEKLVKWGRAFIVLIGRRLSASVFCLVYGLDSTSKKRWLTLEFKIFNITVLTFAIIILTVTAIVCSISYHRRSRQYRRAREYEKTVKYSCAGNHIDITSVKRVQSFNRPFGLMRKQESTRQSSQIYYIYDNPTMAAEEGEEQISDRLMDEQPAVSNEIKNDGISAGIILNPCIFYV